MSVKYIQIRTFQQGVYNFTAQVVDLVQEVGLQEGLCTLFVQHTSASLLIQENADPAVVFDLQNWLNRLVPERDSLFTHTLEGADDMPAHVKSALTATSVSIPIAQGRLTLGTWQGIFLWEHRHHGGLRSVVIHKFLWHRNPLPLGGGRSAMLLSSLESQYIFELLRLFLRL